MKLKEFRTKYPQYSDLSDADVTTKVNTKYPGMIDTERKTYIGPAGKRMPGEVYGAPSLIRGAKGLISKFRPDLRPSDVGKAGAEYFFKTEMPESEMRERVTLAMPGHPVVKNLRQKFPMYDDMDDFSFMDAVTTKYPEYTDVSDDLKRKRQDLYKVIDKIEFKQSIGGTLTPGEAYINSLAIPEDKGRMGQQLFYSYSNMMSFGLQDYILNRMGFDRSRPETGGEAVAAGVGSLAGFIQAPIKVASKILTNLPGLSRLYGPINATSRSKRVLQVMLRGGFTLGTADALLIPKEAQKYGPIQAGTRIQSFGGGMMFGSALGALGFIPSRAARMITGSLFMGTPSTLREDSLEEQVFSYGFGAYMGIHGVKDMIKSEETLRKTIEKGVREPRAQKELLRQSDTLLDRLQKLVMAEGQDYVEVMDSGKKHYVPAYRGWRKGALKEIGMRIKQIRAERTNHLRNDKISQLFEQLKGVKLKDLTDAQIYNINEHIRPENTPVAPDKIFITRPPARPGSATGKHLSLFHNMLRLGYQSLEHMGFGNMFQDGTTGQVFRSDRKTNDMMLLHRQLTNNWKRTVGLNLETARRLFLHRDGRLDLDTMSKNHPEYMKELRTSKQVARYWELLLTLQNRHRAKYGQKPIKPISNYATHVFDALRAQTLAEKYPFPDYIADIIEHIPPKEARQPYLKSRRGATGYKENIWSALDAYAFRATDYVGDDALRHVNGMVRWLGKELRTNEKTGKVSPIDLLGIKKNLQGWADRYAGRPGKIDMFIKNAAKNLPPEIGRYVGNLERLSGIWRTLTYTGAMGWRPKLALRNLGQHSLILGEVGPGYLWKALRTRNSYEARRLLDYSEVLKTRELGFAPEVPYGLTVDTLEHLRRSAFYMFRTADRINVEDAFLAGYYEARGAGKSQKAAFIRGDQVAALTQYMYTKGNRGPITNLWGMSSSVGKIASMFTTWPINKIELDIAWSRPGNRHKMVRYLALVGMGALASAASNRKLRTTAYTGFGAETAIAKKATEGLIGVHGLPLFPRLMIGNDVRKAIGDDDLWKLILYDTRKNAPWWEKF